MQSSNPVRDATARRLLLASYRSSILSPVEHRRLWCCLSRQLLLQRSEVRCQSNIYVHLLRDGSSRCGRIRRSSCDDGTCCFFLRRGVRGPFASGLPDNSSFAAFMRCRGSQRDSRLLDDATSCCPSTTTLVAPAGQHLAPLDASSKPPSPGRMVMRKQVSSDA